MNLKLNKNVQYHVINSLLQHFPSQVDPEFQTVAAELSSPLHDFVIFYFNFP